MRAAKKEFSLAYQTKKVISNRILICSALLALILAGLTVYDVVISIRHLRSTVNESIKPLEDFTISQMMINNPAAVAVKLDAFNRTHNEFKVEWHPNDIGSNSAITWRFPFSWVYNYRLGEIAGYQFGYFRTTGSFATAKTLFNDLMMRLALLFVFLLIILYFLYPLAKKIPEKLFVLPINHLLDMISNQDNIEKDLAHPLPIELKQLKDKIVNLLNQAHEYEKNDALIQLGKVSAQVAHDIRSPLSALQALAAKKLEGLDEANRILLRDAITQIRDIVNNLDQKEVKKELCLTQIAVLLEHTISEKRVTLTEKSITIREKFSVDAYALFAEIIPSEIKRVISNLINNAAEATKSQDAMIKIHLSLQDNKIVIAIADNGSGIPKNILKSLFQRGFTTKDSGHGLGLFHARETLQKLGGDINLTSTEDQGTTVYLYLPAHEAPEWFIKRLALPKNTTFICVDDSVSVLNVWQERLSSFAQDVDLHYCRDKQELLLELGKNNLQHCAYFVDYEFSGEPYTGLDLIKQIMDYKKPTDEVYLVTSRSDEESLQKFCRKNKIFMIPKFFALKIPIEIV